MAERGSLFTSLKVYKEHGVRYGSYYFDCPECGKRVYTSGGSIVFKCQSQGREYDVDRDFRGDIRDKGRIVGHERTQYQP
jgi:tRNA(Ile2) C34 agmatinyltransferase TiaS